MTKTRVKASASARKVDIGPENKLPVEPDSPFR